MVVKFTILVPYIIDLFFSDIEGESIEEIEISDATVIMKTLCPLLDTKEKLPNLKQVTLRKVTIKEFQSNQDCGTDDLQG